MRPVQDLKTGPTVRITISPGLQHAHKMRGLQRGPIQPHRAAQERVRVLIQGQVQHGTVTPGPAAPAAAAVHTAGPAVQAEAAAPTAGPAVPAVVAAPIADRAAQAAVVVPTAAPAEAQAEAAALTAALHPVAQEAAEAAREAVAVAQGALRADKIRRDIIPGGSSSRIFHNFIAKHHEDTLLYNYNDHVPGRLSWRTGPGPGIPLLTGLSRGNSKIHGNGRSFWCSRR